MKWTLFLLVACLAFAGCTDDGDADDGDGDDGTGGSGGSGGNGGSGGTGGTGGSGGSGGNATDDPERQNVTVEISWDGVYRVNGAYSEDTITVPANSTVTLTFTNNDPTFGHDFVVENIEGAATTVLGACTTGTCASETITFDVGAPMETSFYCSVPGHRDNGMEGTFTVA